jgi:hypothetical protein
MGEALTARAGTKPSFELWKVEGNKQEQFQEQSFNYQEILQENRTQYLRVRSIVCRLFPACRLP